MKKANNKITLRLKTLIGDTVHRKARQNMNKNLIMRWNIQNLVVITGSFCYCHFTGTDGHLKRAL